MLHAGEARCFVNRQAWQQAAGVCRTAVTQTLTEPLAKTRCLLIWVRWESREERRCWASPGCVSGAHPLAGPSCRFRLAWCSYESTCTTSAGFHVTEWMTDVGAKLQHLLVQGPGCSTHWCQAVAGHRLALACEAGVERAPLGAARPVGEARPAVGRQLQSHQLLRYHQWLGRLRSACLRCTTVVPSNHPVCACSR